MWKKQSIFIKLHTSSWQCHRYPEPLFDLERAVSFFTYWSLKSSSLIFLILAIFDSSAFLVLLRYSLNRFDISVTLFRCWCLMNIFLPLLSGCFTPQFSGAWSSALQNLQGTLTGLASAASYSANETAVRKAFNRSQPLNKWVCSHSKWLPTISNLSPIPLQTLQRPIPSDIGPCTVLDENFGPVALQVIEKVFPNHLTALFPKITIMYAYMNAGGKRLIERADCLRISVDVAVRWIDACLC